MKRLTGEGYGVTGRELGELLSGELIGWRGFVRSLAEVLLLQVFGLESDVSVGRMGSHLVQLHARSIEKMSASSLSLARRWESEAAAAYR